MHPLATARFPTQDAGYESWFLRAAAPGGGRAIWLRYTVHRAPGGAATGSLWLTRFGDGAPVALKQTLHATPPLAGGSGGGDYVQLGPDSRIGPGFAVGRIETAAGAKASWELSFDTAEPPAPGLPHERFYGWPVPRAKPVTLHPGTMLSGILHLGGAGTAGEDAIDLTGWRGCVGHNWGPEHTPEWVWLQAAGLADDDDAWLEGAFGRVRVGPVLLPWLGSGWLSLDGRRHRLGRLHAARVHPRETGCAFVLAGDGVTVEGTIDAPASSSVAWRYSDPSHTERLVTHASVADLRLRVSGKDGRERTFEVAGAAAYEHGGPQRPVSIPIAPFTDP